MKVPNPTVPLKQEIPKGIEIGDRFAIKGTSPGKSRFTVNLLCGNDHEKSDVAFHFDVRFSFGNSHKSVILNHREAGKWGKEEVKSGDAFPFAPDAPFRIEIVVRSNEIEVTVNEKPFINYRHGESLKKATHLDISGDVTLKSVKIQS